METSTDTNHRTAMTCTKKDTYWYLTLNEILTILCTASIPIALDIYTGITTAQQQKQAEQTREFDLNHAAELRQQTLYDKFITDIYNLDKDGYLNHSNVPWAFANAFYRAAHREWDTVRKADVLQFLVDKRLVGINVFSRQSTDCLSTARICLDELNFDNIQLTSQTGSLNPLNLRYVAFDHVSMINARFTFVNLDDASFKYARLNYAKFNHSSFGNATFDSTELRGTNFGDSDLTGTRFLNVNLTTTILTQMQIEQAYFFNTTLPNGTAVEVTKTTTGEMFCYF